MNIWVTFYTFKRTFRYPLQQKVSDISDTGP